MTDNTYGPETTADELIEGMDPVGPSRPRYKGEQGVDTWKS